MCSRPTENTRAMHLGFLWRNLKHRGHLKDLHVGGKIILKWFL